MEFRDSQILFLDVTIEKNNNRLICDMYHKPTDKNIPPPHTSCHPSSLINSLSFCQFLRVRLIISDHECIERISQSANEFETQGFPDHVLQTSVKPIASLAIPSYRLTKKLAQINLEDVAINYEKKSGTCTKQVFLWYFMKVTISKTHWYTLTQNIISTNKTGARILSSSLGWIANNVEMHKRAHL